MKKTKITCLLLVFALAFTVLYSSISQAKTQDMGAVINAVNLYDVTSDLSIAGSGSAQIVATISARVCSSTEMTVYLQRKNTVTGNWMTVCSWNKSSRAATTSFETTYRVSVKGTYRCKVTGTVTKDGKAETVHVVSDNVTY